MTVSEDFTSVTAPFRGELLALCYRMLGSADEADDLVYQRGPADAYRAHAVLVPAVTSTGIARIVAFQDPGLFRAFRLPTEQPPPRRGPA